MNFAEHSGFEPIHRFGLLVFGLLLTIVILELVRKDLLKEKYALLWLATAFICLVIGLFPSLIVALSSLFKFQYLTVIVVGSLLFILGLVLSFSVALSRLVERNRRLTQEVALLRYEVERLNEKRAD